MGKKLWGIAVIGIMVFCLTGCGNAAPASKKSTGVSKSDMAKRAKLYSDITEKDSLWGEDRKVSPKLPLKKQLKVLTNEWKSWWWDDKEDDYRNIFSVADFDQDGYLEVLVQENEKGQAALYEVNKTGTGLAQCEVSEDIFSYNMDEPLCAYYEEETKTWHLAERGEKARKDWEKFYINFQRYSIQKQELKRETLEGILGSCWGVFGVYEAVDVSRWESAITEEERKQVRKIADTMNNFGHIGDRLVADYAVCDLDQDGKLDVLTKQSMGSGIVRSLIRCYGVDDDDGVKVILNEADRMNHPEKYGADRFILYDALTEKISCYQDGESGEIFYVFTAAEDKGQDLAKKREFKMTWDNILSIHPLKEGGIGSPAKKGEASLGWVGWRSMACKDYQYENALKSYLGWRIQWD